VSPARGELTPKTPVCALRLQLEFFGTSEVHPFWTTIAISCHPLFSLPTMQPRCQLLSVRLSTPQAALRTSQPAQRTYATSEPTPVVRNPLRRRKGGDLGSHLPKHVIPQDALIPAYPYGDHALFKQANRGLYGHQMIQFGNNVSEKTETKTRRNWKPNVLSKSLYSVALKKKVKLRITSSVLKTMDREGGLDEYLLKDNEHRLKELGPLGWALRWTLLQKPVVLDRMRTDAAALGLDQATIDAQWPTPDMLTQQKVAQRGLVRAAELIGEEYEDDAEDAEDLHSGELHTIQPPQTYTKQEKRAMKEAGREYAKAVNAAGRYLARNTVDSEEEGLKLAFIRAKEREQAGALLKENFAKRLDDKFSTTDLEEVRTRFNLPDTLAIGAVKKIAYNQWRRQEIEKVGSYDAWRAKSESEKKIVFTAKADEAGGVEAFKAQLRDNYAQAIAEAETASTNEMLDVKRRKYLETAINKADRAIKARASGGEDAYVEWMVEEMRQGQPPQPANLKRPSRSANQEKAGGDAWAAVVDANNRSVESRPDA
jgi:large subunit ribosomal protein L28